MGREAEPHVDSQLNRDLNTFIFVHGVLTNKNDVRENSCPTCHNRTCNQKYMNVLFLVALHLHEDGLGLSTVFATSLFTEVRVQDLMCWNSGKSYPLLSS